MDQTHIHLIITHLPIFGSILAAIVLANGIFTKSLQVKTAAYYLFIISSLGAIVAYITGEAAEETVENIQGIVHETVELHEDFAIFALWSLCILGVASLAAITISRIKHKSSNSVAIAILILALISFGLVARTGYLGGQIRHTEIAADATAVVGDSEQEDEHE